MKEIKVKTFIDKNNKICGVELLDKTIVLIDNKNKGLRIAFPMKKFWNIFNTQHNEKRKYLEVLFEKDELEIITKLIGADWISN